MTLWLPMSIARLRFIRSKRRCWPLFWRKPPIFKAGNGHCVVIFPKSGVWSVWSGCRTGASFGCCIRKTMNGAIWSRPPDSELSASSMYCPWLSASPTSAVMSWKRKAGKPYDGQFRTTKEYEWIHSVSKATKQDFIRDPEKFHRKTKLVEQFFINDQGCFEKSEIVDTLPDYNAVVFYFNPADKPEMWDATIPQLQAFCEENGILYEEVSGNYNRVTIRNFELTFAMETDITPYVEGVSSGMVMMRKNEVPKTVNFGSFEYMQMEIRRYFKVRSDLES